MSDTHTQSDDRRAQTLADMLTPLELARTIVELQQREAAAAMLAEGVDR
jgi:hypothetical protein